jgi:Protein of unknown function (DUF2845)
MKAFGLTLALAIAYTVAQPASAAALRCGTRLVYVGDPEARVRALCGEPAQVASRTETRSTWQSRRGPSGAAGGAAYSVTIQVDVWTYDFGPQRFMQELTFENGVLRAMRDLGYGTRRPETPNPARIEDKSPKSAWNRPRRVARPHA